MNAKKEKKWGGLVCRILRNTLNEEKFPPKIKNLNLVSVNKTLPQRNKCKGLKLEKLALPTLTNVNL